MKPTQNHRLTRLEAIAGRDSLPEIVFTCGDETIATLRMAFTEAQALDFARAANGDSPMVEDQK